MAHHVHGRHGQPGAVGEHADVAFEVDVLEFCGLGPGLEASQLVRRARGCGGGLADDGGVVHHELAIERDDAAVAGDDQRIDFHQFGVEGGIDRVEFDERVGNISFGRGEPQAPDQRPGISE